MKGNGLKLQICNWKTVYKLPLSTLVLMSPAFSPGRKGPTPANPNPTNINVSCLYCTHKTNSQIVSRRNQRQCRSFAALLDLGLVSLRFLDITSRLVLDFSNLESGDEPHLFRFQRHAEMPRRRNAIINSCPICYNNQLANEGKVCPQ